MMGSPSTSATRHKFCTDFQFLYTRFWILYDYWRTLCATRFSTLDGTPKNAIFQLGSFHRHLFVNILRPTDYLFHLKTFQTKKTFSQKQKLLEAHLKLNFNTQLARLLKNSSVLTRLAINVARWLLISRTASGTEMLFWTTTVDGSTLLTAIFELNLSGASFT